MLACLPHAVYHRSVLTELRFRTRAPCWLDRARSRLPAQSCMLWYAQHTALTKVLSTQLSKTASTLSKSWNDRPSSSRLRFTACQPPRCYGTISKHECLNTAQCSFQQRPAAKWSLKQSRRKVLACEPTDSELRCAAMGAGYIVISACWPTGRRCFWRG